MDFTIDLDDYFIDGKDEAKQTITTILSNERGEFVQDFAIGCPNILHTSATYIDVVALFDSMVNNIKDFTYTNLHYDENGGNINVSADVEFNGNTFSLLYENEMWYAVD
jgi:hypothetical protein